MTDQSSSNSEKDDDADWNAALQPDFVTSDMESYHDINGHDDSNIWAPLEYSNWRAICLPEKKAHILFSLGADLHCVVCGKKCRKYCNDCSVGRNSNFVGRIADAAEQHKRRTAGTVAFCQNNSAR
jgi:hypothetical protein